VRAEDQFHVGVVVDDLESTVEVLSELFGYEWCDEMGGPIPVTLPTGDAMVDLRFVYSRTAPRLEIIRTVAGTLWEPAGSGIHHVGYWSDDVAGDAAALVRRGFATEATGSRPDGLPYWSFHRSPTSPRIELVSRSVQPALEQYWKTGRIPS
jgi:glyoxalase/bleomycin resistance protein/dioxygenase superfamily protein